MTTTIRAMLNKDRASVSGYYPLVIRVIHQRKKKLIYSPYRLKKEEFDDEAEMALWSSLSCYAKAYIDEINHFINGKKHEIERLLVRLKRERKEEFTVDDIVDRFKRQSQNRLFFCFIEKEIQSKQKSNRFGTAEVYTSCRNSILRFTENKKLTFPDITYRFVSDYIDHLRERGTSENTIHMYLRNFRAVYNKAQKEGLTTTKIYPFTDIKMSGMRTAKRALPKDELRKIVYLDLSGNQGLETVRDVFMFSFYARGMSLVDILKLKHSDISDGYIHYIRNKTGQYFQIAVVPQLKMLIEKYRTDSEYVMPYLQKDNLESLYRQYRKALCQINTNLKRIGKMAGIEKTLTSYVARHSWATIAKNEGVPIATISEGLGHTTEKTTQIYLRAFDHRIIDEVNSKIIAL